jgi:cell division protein FtsZ
MRRHRDRHPQREAAATVDKQMALAAAFQYADDILRQAVQGISDLITIPARSTSTSRT